MPIFAPKSFNLRIIHMLLFHRNSEWGTHSEGIQLISFKSWRLNVNTLRLSRFKGVADSFLLKCAEYVTVQSCSVLSLSTLKCSFCVSRWKSSQSELLVTGQLHSKWQMHWYHVMVSWHGIKCGSFYLKMLLSLHSLCNILGCSFT